MLKGKLKILLFVLLVFQAFHGYCWFDSGHMVIATIAYKDLDEVEKSKIDELIKILKDAEPRCEGFVKAATWMDGIKDRGLRFYDSFHYINQYYSVHPAAKNLTFNQCNVVWGIEESIKTLKRGDAGRHAKALALRFLIHLVGDVHQPMHCASRVSELTPEGDRGGNDFPIKKIPFGKYKGKPSSISNLHLLWDSGVTFFAGIEAMDYPSKKRSIQKNVVDIEGYIKSLSENRRNEIIGRIKGVKEPAAWALESYKVAVKYCYKGIKPKAGVSNAYTLRGQKISKIQAYVAGKRLGQLLKNIF